MDKRVTVLALNEINFDFVDKYITKGHLPTFKRLIECHGLSRTTADVRYEDTEPWIQWVTAQTGLSAQEHGVRRLGDIVDHDFHHIWDHLEEHGIRSTIISPMNGKTNRKDIGFFVPDPWTQLECQAASGVRKLHGAISQIVASNASGQFQKSALLTLGIGLLFYARPANYLKYLRLVKNGLRSRWARAILLDLLLGDLLLRQQSKRSSRFSWIFLNAGAHIQHHYMFNSAAYDGQHKNPDWYMDKTTDPLLATLQIYDDLVGQIETNDPGARIMIATGLTQDPVERPIYYWRLKDHMDCMKAFGVQCADIIPLMSRDFVMNFDDAARADTAEVQLGKVTDEAKKRIFEIDNRGTSLFVSLIFNDAINSETKILIEGKPFSGFDEMVAFVAIKNGHHNSTGFFLDTSETKTTAIDNFKLEDIPKKISKAFGLSWSGNAAS
ncbi:MAG: hypothetical protein VX054_04455 [Pseudomonadota bacterium]|nr:hypothetical protein [Pseudomonadota bacterium]